MKMYNGIIVQLIHIKLHFRAQINPIKYSEYDTKSSLSSDYADIQLLIILL